MLSTETPGTRALRRGRVSVRGQIYLITTVTAQRRQIFTDLWTARAVVNAMRDLHQEKLVSSLAFVVMPDHLHWLLEVGSDPLAGVMRLLKTRSARRINQQLGVRDIVWQAGYHDHAARREESIVALARYVVGNPVRAGLVKSVGDYPHWDSVWM